MYIEDPNDPGTAVDPDNGPGDEPDDTQPSPDDPEPEPTVTTAPTTRAKDPAVVTMSSRTLADLKNKERAKGKRLAMSELQERAKKAGFASFEEMERAAARARQSNARSEPDRQPVRTSNGQPNKQDKRWDKEREQLLEQTRQLNRKHSTEEKRRKAAEKKLESMEAEKLLERAAIRAGVQDVDYALELLRRKLKAMSPEDMAAFDETKFFKEDLRTSHPYLYGIQERPATTGPGAQTAPKGPQQPNAVKKDQAEEGDKKRDARNMSQDEYTKLLKQHGLTDPRSLM